MTYAHNNAWNQENYKQIVTTQVLFDLSLVAFKYELSDAIFRSCLLSPTFLGCAATAAAQKSKRLGSTDTEKRLVEK